MNEDEKYHFGNALPIPINATVDEDELIQAIINHYDSEEQVLRFVVKLDEAMSDWEFTYLLIDYFKTLEKEHDENVEEKTIVTGRIVKRQTRPGLLYPDGEE